MDRFFGFKTLIFTLAMICFNNICICQDIIINNYTIRIECFRDTIINGNKQTIGSVGTGFFFLFKIDSASTVPVIVTNNHLIENSKTGILTFTERDPTTGRQAYGKKIIKEIDSFGLKWLPHPTEDLAIFFLNPLLADMADAKEKIPFYIFLDENYLPPASFFSSVKPQAEVLMVGYPGGFWDSTNNLSIVRSGLTATPVNLDFNGQPKFLVDIPIYPGSSGSPIFDYSQLDKHGSMMVGKRSYLLGIASKSQDYIAEGELKIRPNDPKYQVTIKLPFNIAIAIKSNELLKFKPIIKTLISKP